MKVHEYLGSALSLLIWYNQSEFDSNAYGEDRVIRSSELFSKQTDISKGQFTETFVELHQLADYTDYLQLGQFDEVQFFHTTFKETVSSLHNTWPTIEANGLFKFDSFYFELSSSMFQYERQTYSALEFVGDIGGLYDGLNQLSRMLLAPIATIALKQKLLGQVFSALPDE